MAQFNWTSQTNLDNRCLAFFVLTNRLPNAAGLTYSLESGMVCWRDSADSDWNRISLRENSRLAAWEPMTFDKLGLLAHEIGLVGPLSESKLEDPQVLEIAVSPQGFIFHWDHFSLEISDIGRLTGEAQSLQSASLHDERWSRFTAFNIDEEIVGPGIGKNPPRPAQVGSRRTPVPEDLSEIEVDSLADCSTNASDLLDRSDNDWEGEYTPEAQRFIAQHFGIDASTIDWHSATSARIVNHSFADTAPFDPIAAITALKLALRNTPTTRTTLVRDVEPSPWPSQNRQGPGRIS
jgi:hypothetical protein